jgi:uncharacterized protein (DUF2345 family)
MHGTGDKMRNRGTRVVLDNDPVLCPCGKNRVIAASNAKCFVHKIANTGRSSAEKSPSGVAQAAPYDEQFTFLDEARRPLSNVRYRIVTDSGQIFTGRTNTSGQTKRVCTDAMASLMVHIKED